MQPGALPIFLFLACAAALAIGLVVVSRLVNPDRAGRVNRMPYESGMDPFHDTRRRFDVRFHLLAIAFLVFDVELLFLYPWAVASHPAPVVASSVQSGAQKGTVPFLWPPATKIGTVSSPNSEMGAVPVLWPAAPTLVATELGATKIAAQKIGAVPSPQGVDLAVASGWIENRHLVFAGAMVFVLLLTVGYVYDWRKGVFRWR